ncbi:uncharacterized protein EV420DRAFT_1279418 [Desarmillaria tabescens]|uniref:Uncharacterized protein n=1 Tax=Armillaria tabescens TaxID=1929756 RepID=A0AA39JBT4_ARMTA|nr:uncharacterized protein EV420DRAFT_1279418 [Desarmillaria tabescens]KAK0439733.1 hypothetical protein EV420DRAFT_1279418 [Desarmillaria tabescens]
MNDQLKTIDEHLDLAVEGRQNVYNLAGTIYHGQEHFTSRVIINHECWFHDGLSTGRDLVLETQGTTMDMTRCRGKKVTVAIYTLKTRGE